MQNVFVIHFTGGREMGTCVVGALDAEQAKRVFRIRLGDEWSISRVLSYAEFLDEEREVDPGFQGLTEEQIPELKQAKVLDLGT